MDQFLGLAFAAHQAGSVQGHLEIQTVYDSPEWEWRYRYPGAQEL
jgi:hypothetical protein